MITCAEVVSAATIHFGRSEAELFRSRRGHELTRERNVAWYIARHVAKRSPGTIAREMGGFDPVTISSAICRISERLPDDVVTATDIAVLNRLLTGLEEQPVKKPALPHPLLPSARAAIAAWKAIDKARFTPGERAAREHFEHTMKALQSAIEGA